MFRKAKRLSKRFGLNKERCTEKTTSSNTNYNKTVPENHGEGTPQFLLQINKANTRANSPGESMPNELVPNDSDTTSTRSSSNNELIVDDTLKSRPPISKSQTAPNNEIIYDTPTNNLTQRLSMLDSGNLELLLSMETQARMDAQAEREKEQLEQAQHDQEIISAPRPTKIKFELPVTPPRSRSPANPRLQYPRARPVRSLPEEGLTANALRHPIPLNSKGKPRRAGWRQLFGERDDEEELPLPITLDSRVRLKLRPLPTFGYVRFMGGVEFGAGEYIGVELDHGVGNCDGSMEGVRYFDADGNRGIFCKRRDLEVVSD